jgi:hypothetical protein
MKMLINTTQSVGTINIIECINISTPEKCQILFESGVSLVKVPIATEVVSSSLAPGEVY